jgi:tRNA pseudouridine38-40 synthase
MNSVLPHDVVILRAQETPLDFNARYSAKARRYKYFISPEPTALRRNYCWQVYRPLDEDLMNSCLPYLAGERSFRSFCKVQEDSQQHRCTVSSVAWHREDGCFVLDISANRFLHGMVRTIVGTLVNVGRGHTSMEEFKAICAEDDRALAGMAAPAKGLFLEEVVY